MIDFDKARATMVDCQIRPNDVTNRAVLDAFSKVPREKFVSPAQRPLAYIDEDLAVSAEENGRYLMEAMSMAKLVQLAEVEESDIVLDVGCATGYSTAILAELCSSVVAVESIAELADLAGNTLVELGCDNAVVVQGVLPDGLAKEGPYNVIYVGGSVDEVPQKLLDQLKDGGRLVVVEGQGNAGVARIYRRQGDGFYGQTAFNSAVMPLPGFEKAEEFVF